MENKDGRKTIVICEYISTGINYAEDARARGYTPVLVEGRYVGSPEDVERLKAARDKVNERVKNSIKIIKEDEYENVLKQVKELDPALVIAGSEFGVALAAELSADLGLPANPVDRIPYMTHKDMMQKALADHGLRSIRGRVVRSEKEAIEFYRELGLSEVVVKPVRGAGSQGVYLCRNQSEMLAMLRRNLDAARGNELENHGVLVQERIRGTEYVVNTVSCNGRHRVVTIGQYDKYVLSNGAIAYNYYGYVTELEAGHSRLVRYVNNVLDAIGIKYGPVHGEYMIDEDGPVLIEVNCRPMGGGLDRYYSELVSGQHETDSALDGYLDPEKFSREAAKPYKLKRYGVSKDLVLLKDTVAITAPVVQICRRLRSYYSASYDQIGRTAMLPQTKDMETEAGLVYLIHDDEKQVRKDCELLHQLELKYPDILFQRSRNTVGHSKTERDLEHVMKAAGCSGATIIFSDRPKKLSDAAVISHDGLKDAYDSYDNGILDLTDPRTFADLEILVQQIFMFMDKVRVGGRVIVPESTYCHLPYGIEGMEILFRVSGMLMELPSADESGLLIATVQE